jgi:transposase InsO family protein
MRFRFIHEHFGEFQLGIMCRVLEVTRGGYHAWRSREKGPRSLDEAVIREAAAGLFAGSNQTYGHRRICAGLAVLGMLCGPKRVARLMKKWGMQVKTKRKFRLTTDSRHGFPIAENLLDRQFDQEEPNIAWVSDMTYIQTDEGWLFLATTLDLFSRKIVGWAMDDHMRTDLVTRSLQMAIDNRCHGSGYQGHSQFGQAGPPRAAGTRSWFGQLGPPQFGQARPPWFGQARPPVHV